MAVMVSGSEIWLSGVVGGSANGDSFWEPDGFSSGDVVKALAEVGRDNPVLIHLNSGGGMATEGAAIHASLSQHRGAVHINMEGVVASAASLLAMAADTLTISPGATFMIHDVASVTFGTAEEHRKTISMLESMGDSYAAIYAERSGKSVEDIRAMMAEEWWADPAKAVAEGFVDAVGVASNDNDPEPTAFAYGVYSKAPEKLVALASARGWKPRAMMAAPPASTRQKEITMTDKTTEAGAQPAVDATAATAVAVTLAAAGMNADQIKAFLDAGGTQEKATARATEIGQIKADIETAKRTNPAVSLTVEDAIARNLSPAQALAEMWPQVTAQANIVPHATATGPEPTAKEPAKPLMVAAAERVAEQAKKYRLR